LAGLRGLLVAAFFNNGVGWKVIAWWVCVLVLDLDRLGGMIPVPVMLSVHSQSRLEMSPTYQGSLTDQFRKIAAKLNNVTSVITALPFSQNNPPAAGNKANARGTECQWEGSWLDTTSSALLALGSSKSSVEDLNDCAESEKVELRRFRNGCRDSAKVAARPRARWRRGDKLDLAVLLAALDICEMMGGLIVRSLSAILAQDLDAGGWRAMSRVVVRIKVRSGMRPYLTTHGCRHTR